MKKADLVLGAIGVIGLGIGGFLFASRAKAATVSAPTSSAGGSASDYTGGDFSSWVSGQSVGPEKKTVTPTNGVVVNTGVGFFDDMVMGVTNFFEKRGIRNNNPGNLVITNIPWNGKVPLNKNTDGVFEQFYRPVDGLRAMYMDIRGDIEKDGLNTIRKLITAYAPPKGNNTEAYIKSVVYQVGIGADTKLVKANYMALMKAIIMQENGKQPYSDALLQDAIKAAG